MHFREYPTAELFSKAIFSRINQLRGNTGDYSGYIHLYFLEYVSFMEEEYKEYVERIDRERDMRWRNDQSRKPSPKSIPSSSADKLDDLTVKQLQEIAKQLGIKGYSKLRKLDLIQVLRGGGA